MKISSKYFNFRLGAVIILSLLVQSVCLASVYIDKPDDTSSKKSHIIPEPGIMRAVSLNNAEKPAYISKSQLNNYLQTRHYQLQIAPDIGHVINPANLASDYFYYQNPATQTVGVAKSPKAARFLTHALPEVFFTRAGDTLSATLTRWAKRAGYQLDWLSNYDFPIEYNYAFYGSLTDNGGPLDQMLQSIKDSNFSLRAQVTRNHVILIQDNDYQSASINT